MIGQMICNDGAANPPTQALVMAQQDERNKSILQATRAVMFMGVPHDGSDAAILARRVANILDLFIAQNTLNLADLEKESKPLQDTARAFGHLQGFEIITVMESKETMIPYVNRSVLVCSLVLFATA
jgi:hypothetical protein